MLLRLQCAIVDNFVHYKMKEYDEVMTQKVKVRSLGIPQARVSKFAEGDNN